MVAGAEFWQTCGMPNSAAPAAAEPIPAPRVQSTSSAASDKPHDARGASNPPEIGGRAGPDPTRFGDWEKNGRCIDF